MRPSASWHLRAEIRLLAEGPTPLRALFDPSSPFRETDMTTVAGGGARQGRANPVASMIGVGVSTLVLAMLILGVVVYRVYHVRRQRTEMDARQQQASVVHMRSRRRLRRS